VHEPKIFGDDTSSRRITVVEANGNGWQIAGVEQSCLSLGVFRMTPIMRDGKSVATIDVGSAFGKEFVDRAKQRFGIDLAVHCPDGGTIKTLSSTFGDQAVATADELKGVFDGAPLHRDATLNGDPAALHAGQIRNYAGQPIAILETIKDTTDYEVGRRARSATSSSARLRS
jgi:methyl-accepting chemotaxis protein